MHIVMQHLPFGEWAAGWGELSPGDQWTKVADLLSLLVAREILRPEDRAVLDPSALIGLLNSALGQRLFSARKIWREVPFTLSLPRSAGAPVLVQGIIDALLFSSGSGPVEVVDYKSDLGVGPETLRRRYALQLAFYALAVERLLKLPVATCTLYSFGLAETVTISAEDRHKALAQALEKGGYLLPPDRLSFC